MFHSETRSLQQMWCMASNSVVSNIILWHWSTCCRNMFRYPLYHYIKGMLALLLLPQVRVRHSP